MVIHDGIKLEVSRFQTIGFSMKVSKRVIFFYFTFFELLDLLVIRKQFKNKTKCCFQILL